MNENFNQNYEPINSTNQMYGSRARVEENVLAQAFIFMTIALIITAIASYITLHSPNLLNAIFTNSGGLFYGLLIGEIVVVIVATRAMNRNQLFTSAVLFVLYSGINGVTLSLIFLVYQLGSVYSIFIMSAVIFAITAVYGVVTKKDLSTVGNICFMGLIAIIVLSIGNMFIKSSGMDLVISAVGVFIFVGLAAYDSQKIKKMSAVSNSDNITTMALLGALMLYLDFINLFLRLLRLFGKRN